MSTLTEISISARKIAIVTVIAIFVYILLRGILGIIISYWKSTQVSYIPPPDAKFGKLPSPDFENISTSSSGLKFLLENIEGRPPETTTSGKVYAMPKKLPSILGNQRVRNFAIKLGFGESPQNISGTVYQFTDTTDPLRSLEIDSVTMNYKLEYDLIKNKEIINSLQILNKEAAITETKDFIRFNNLFDESILAGTITTQLYKFDSTNLLTLTNSLSQTNIIRLNFNRNNLDGMKVLPPEYDKAYIYAYYSQIPILKYRILELNYTFWPIAENDFGTYPLKSGQQAWQDLLDGYALIVTMGTNTAKNQITIRNIYLAYYDSKEPQGYLQPIFVFEGDNNFIAYMPAVENSYLE